MKIAFFVKSFPKVSETFVITQIKGLIDLGHDVHIVAVERSSLENVHPDYELYEMDQKTTYLRESGSQHNYQKIIRRIGNVFRAFWCDAASRKRVFKLFESNSPYLKNLYLAEFLLINKVLDFDVIIAHFGPNGVLSNDLRKMGLFKGELVTFFHGYDVSEWNTVERYLPSYQNLFHEGALCMTVNQLWRNKLMSWGCPSEKVKVHHMGVDTDAFSANSAVIHSPLRVLFVGRDTPKKGLKYAIEAVMAASELIDIEFNIIGVDKKTVEIEELLAKDVKHVVNCHGSKPNDVVREYLKESDVFLLPSITADNGDMEGIPVALMEAMIMGKVTVSTYHSGIPELIDNGVDGFLITEKNVAELSKVLCHINQLSSHTVNGIRVKAKAKVIEHFSLSKQNKLLSDELCRLNH